MPKGIPLTVEEQERRRKEIFDSSLHLILEKGFNETTMAEIAKAAGVGKSTLYDYFKSKDEIMVSYFQGQLQEITERASEIINQDGNVTQKLSNIMQMHLDYLMDSKHTFLKLSFEVQRLSLGSQQKIQTARYAYQDLIRQLVEDGISAGEFRPVNALLAARSLMTLLSTAVFTSRPTGTPEEMTEEVLKIFFKGIQT